MRYLPNTGVKLWEENLWPEDLDLADENDDALISLYIEVISALYEKDIMGKAFLAFTEFTDQLKEEA